MLWALSGAGSPARDELPPGAAWLGLSTGGVAEREFSTMRGRGPDSARAAVMDAGRQVELTSRFRQR
jgi:hypothetical protein